MENKIVAEKKENLISPVRRTVPKDGLFNPVRRIPSKSGTKKVKEKAEDITEKLICPVSRLGMEDNENNEADSLVNCSIIQEIKYGILMTKSEPREMHIDNYWFRNGQLVCIEDLQEIKLANFWLEIVAEKNYINLLGDVSGNVVKTETSVKWKVRILCCNRWFEAEVSRDELQNEKKLLTFTKDRAMIESSVLAKNLYAKYVLKLIELEAYETLNIFSTSGWIYHSKWGWIYLTKEGAIGIQGCNCFANVPYEFQYNSCTVGTVVTFREFWNLRYLCRGNIKNSIFLMHFSCLATMATLFQKWGCGINFIVALIGTTNSLKTSCAKVFTRMFKRPENSGVDIRFSSTEIAILEEMERYGDAIMTVDDYLPYDDKRSQNIQKKKLDTIIRSYGDHEARKRSEVYAKINGVPTYTPIRGACLITGETIDFSSESSATRVVQLNFERGQVDTKLLKHFQENNLILPTFLYGFICYVREDIQTIMEVVTAEVENARYNCENIITPRFKDTFGIMSAAVLIFYAYAVKKGFLSIEEAEIYKKEDISMIKSIIIKNDEETKVKSPATIICLALEQAISDGRVETISPQEAAVKSEFKYTVVDAEDYIYILPDTLCELYLQYCRNVGRESLYKDGRALNAPLKKENVLLVKNEGDSQRSSHKIRSKTEKRFLFMKKRKIRELTDIFNNF